LCAPNESEEDLLKQHTLKELKLAQLGKVLYKLFTAMNSKGKPMTGPTINEKAKSFDDEMEINDKCAFCKGSNKKILVKYCKNLCQYSYCLIIWYIQLYSTCPFPWVPD